MMRWLQPRLTYANVMSTIAVFGVLAGGGAYAASKIGADDIKRNAVRSKHIKDAQVKRRDIARPEAWRAVRAGSTTSNLCTDPVNTAVFCSARVGGGPLFAWKNFGAPHPTAAFYKDQLGIVHLKGVVRPPFSLQFGASPQRFGIFRLSAGYRPDTTRIFASVGAADRSATAAGVLQETAARIDVQADGLVIVEVDCYSDLSGCSANRDYFTLDGITFRRDE